MTREEIKARDIFEKTENSYRKQVSKKYGWKQRGYINWKIVSDYFFCLYHHRWGGLGRFSETDVNIDLAKRHDGVGSHSLSSRNPGLVENDERDVAAVEVATNNDSLADSYSCRFRSERRSEAHLPHGGRQLSSD